MKARCPESREKTILAMRPDWWWTQTRVHHVRKHIKQLTIPSSRSADYVIHSLQYEQQEIGPPLYCRFRASARLGSVRHNSENWHLCSLCASELWGW